MDTQRSPSILPSILHAIPGPSHIMYPHTITDPPPNFSVPLTNLSLRPSTTFFHAHFFPFDPKQLIFVSSDQTTLFQSSTVQSLCPSAKSSLAFLCLALSNGFFFLHHSLHSSFLQVPPGGFC